MGIVIRGPMGNYDPSAGLVPREWLGNPDALEGLGEAFAAMKAQHRADQAAEVSGDFELDQMGRDAGAVGQGPQDPAQGPPNPDGSMPTSDVQGPANNPLNAHLAAIKAAANKIKDKRARALFIHGQGQSLKEEITKAQMAQTADHIGDTIAAMSVAPGNEATADALMQLGQSLEHLDGMPPEVQARFIAQVQQNVARLQIANAGNRIKTTNLQAAFGEGGYADQVISTLPPGSKAYNDVLIVKSAGLSGAIDYKEAFRRIDNASKGWVDVPLPSGKTWSGPEDQAEEIRQLSLLGMRAKAGEMTPVKQAEIDSRERGQDVQAARIEEQKAGREQRQPQVDANTELLKARTEQIKQAPVEKQLDRDAKAPLIEAQTRKALGETGGGPKTQTEDQRKRLISANANARVRASRKDSYSAPSLSFEDATRQAEYFVDGKPQPAWESALPTLRKAKAKGKDAYQRAVVAAGIDLDAMSEEEFERYKAALAGG